LATVVPPTTTERDNAVTAPPAWLVGLLALSCGLTVANIYYAQPLLVEIGRTFGIGTAAAGGLITATQLGYAAGMLLLVPLGDRFENRRLVSTLLAITTAGLVLAGLSPVYPALVGAALVIGSTSVVAQILVPYAADLAPDESRGRIVGRVMSGLLAGILLSRTLGSLLAEATNWRVVYLTSAGVTAALVLTLRLALPARAPKTTVGYGALLRSTVDLMRRHPALRRRTAYQAAMFGTFSVFWTTIAFVLSAPPFDYSQLQIGLFALVGAGGTLVAPLAGRWADNGIGRPMTGIAFAVAAAAYGAAALGRRHIVVLALAAAVLDAAVQTTHIIGQHTIYRLDPSARARVNSGYLAVFFVGGAVGSQLGSVLYHDAGWSAVTALGAAMPLAAGVFYLTEFRPRRRRSRAGAAVPSTT
jgi:predicted MFS family arabinose efflux permease